MWQEIIQGDDGSVIELNLTDNGKPINVTGATIEALIKIKSYTFIKQCNITDAINGQVELVLNSSDTSYEGLHAFQLTIKYTDGRSYTSQIQRYNVKKKIGLSIPPLPKDSELLEILRRLEISEDGNLMIDGIEQIGGNDATYDGGTFLSNNTTDVIDGGEF